MWNMTRRMSVLALVLGAAAVLVPATAQQRPPDNGGDHLKAAIGNGLGAIKHVARNNPLQESHVGMPGPLDTDAGPMAAGSELLPSRGSAIVQPTGGAFISPKQQADREIRQLIRKLG